MASIKISQVGSTFTTRVTEGDLRADFEGALQDGTRVQVWRREEQASGASEWREVGNGWWAAAGGQIADVDYGVELAGMVDLECALIDRDGVEPSLAEPRRYPVETAQEVAALRPDLCAGDAVAAERS